MSESLHQSIRDFQKGDLEAFTHIYQKQFNHVYYIALQYTKDDSRAQDIAQEVFIEIYRSLGDLTKVENFNAWLNKIVYSFFIKSIRSKQDEMRVHLSETTDLEEIISSDESEDPREIYQKQELLDAIQLSFNELSTVQQEVARMRFYDDLSMNEISDILEIPIGTVKSRINSIRTQLQKSLQGEYKQYRTQLAPVMYLFFNGLISNIDIIKTHDVTKDVGTIAAAGAMSRKPKIKKTKATTIGIGATVIGLPLALSTVPMVEVKVQDVSYRETWTHEDLELTIQLDRSIDNLMVTLDDAPLSIQQEDSRYQVSVPTNGTIAIHQGTKLIYTESIDNIDKKAPTLELTQAGEVLTIVFSDDQSGIDMSTLSIIDKVGNSVSFSSQGNTITLEKDDDEPYSLSGSDFAGNTFTRKILKRE